MPADRGRASKACAACRKQKTRCYETASGRACLRCDRLGQECTLSSETTPVHHAIPGSWAGAEGAGRNQDQDARYHPYLKPLHSQSTHLSRIDRLERLVNVLARRLDYIESDFPRHRGTQVTDTPKQDHTPLTTNLEEDSDERAPAPLFVLRDVTAQSGFRPTDRTATSTPSRTLSDDIILKGLLTEKDATALLTLFEENYGRWVSFNSMAPITRLLEDIRKSPLLLAACCLIAVRHTSHDLASRLAPKFFTEAKSLLSSAMLSVPQPIEFFQAALILSMWSTTIGQIPLGIDSWLLSGFALQHSVASGLFAPTMDSHHVSLDKRELDYLCIWNHLCLVHLQ